MTGDEARGTFLDAFDLAARLVAQRDGLEAVLVLISHKNDVVRAAYAAGFSKSELSRFTGMARTTVDRILNVPRSARPGPAA